MASDVAVRKEETPTTHEPSWDFDRRMDALVNSFFDNAFTSLWPLETYDWGRGGYRVPRTYREEDEKNVTFKLEIPGMDEDNIVVTQKGNYLEVQAKEEKESKTDDSYRMRKAEFMHRLPMPADVDADKINAKYRNGVLELRMPKLKGKRIPLK